MVSADNIVITTASPEHPYYDKNLFAYCDNNPVVREDAEGEFWNFVIGAVVGGVIGGVIAGVSSYMQTGKVDWGSVVINTAVGAAGGAIAASGLGPFAQAGFTAAVSGVSSFADQVRAKGIQNVNYWDVAGNAVIGGVTSLAGSAIGAQMTKNLTRSANNMINKGANKIVNGEQSLLSGSRYGKGSIKVGTNLLKQGIKDLNTARGYVSTIGSVIGIGTGFGYNYVKSRFLKW